MRTCIPVCKHTNWLSSQNTDSGEIQSLIGLLDVLLSLLASLLDNFDCFCHISWRQECGCVRGCCAVQVSRMELLSVLSPRSSGLCLASEKMIFWSLGVGSPVST